MQSAATNGIDAIKDKLLEERSFGEVKIRDIRAREHAGFDDDSYVHLVVYVDDPAAGKDTWPVLDVFKLRQRVSELASESDVELPQIVVDVYPQHQTEQPDQQHRSTGRA